MTSWNSNLKLACKINQDLTEDFPPINVGTYVFVQPPKKHLSFFQVLAHSPAAGKKKEKKMKGMRMEDIFFATIYQLFQLFKR